MTQLYPAITNGVLFDLFHTHKKMIAGAIHISACQEGHEHAIWVENCSWTGQLVGHTQHPNASAVTQLYQAITNEALFDLFHIHKKMIEGVIHISASQEGHEYPI